jgi:prephenate dehydrogenase (NADP+)
MVIVATKIGAIVGGQTSCKAPEIAAFEKYLPDDVEILTCHSLHGPNVDPRGQPLVLFPLCMELNVGVDTTSGDG